MTGSGSAQKVRFDELVDVGSLQSLMDSFYQVIGIANAIIDLEGKVITSSGWQDVCVDYHRVNPETCRRCIESDTSLASSMLQGEQYAVYNCLNGLIDTAAPIIVDGQHLANVFTGQFFFAPPDLEFFRAQARKFGFEEAPYLEAVSKVPILPRERVPAIMQFYAQFAQMLAANGLDRKRQIEAEQNLARLNAELAERVHERTRELTENNQRLSIEIVEREAVEGALWQEKRLAEDIINSLPGIFYIFDESGVFVRWNHKFLEVTGYSIRELESLRAVDFFDVAERDLVAAAISRVFDSGEASVEAFFLTKSGRKIPYYFSGRRIMMDGRPLVIGLGIDNTERKLLEQELQRQARTDLLTGVANRRYFLELAEQELARTRRYARPLSVLMLDLDWFKAVNDTHGHHVGDLVLQKLCEVCRSTLRTLDVLGRVGGEEFAILLPETDGETAFEVAERLRRSIAEARLELADGSSLHFTASIGISTLKGIDSANIDSLLNQADEGLYAAKRAGRNRVRAVAVPD